MVLVRSMFQSPSSLWPCSPWRRLWRPSYPQGARPPSSRWWRCAQNRRREPLQLVQQFWQDLRYALRQLRRTPGFAITAVLTLALGVGATTAIFTLIYQVMLRSLPVTAPEHLYKLGTADDCCHNGGGLYGGWRLFS